MNNILYLCDVKPGCVVGIAKKYFSEKDNYLDVILPYDYYLVVNWFNDSLQHVVSLRTGEDLLVDTWITDFQAYRTTLRLKRVFEFDEMESMVIPKRGA